MAPEVRWVEGEGGWVAHQVVDGPAGGIDVVFLTSWGSTIDLLWESPLAHRFLSRLSRLGRLVLFDKRGTGLSDPVPATAPWLATGAIIEDAVADLMTVLDSVGSESAVLVANFTSTPPALMAAAVHPSRIAGLVLVDPCPTAAPPSADFPPGLDPGVRGAVAARVRERWGTGLSADMCPSLAGDPAFVEWVSRLERVALPRGVAARQWDHLDYDVRPLLPTVVAPALVAVHLGAMVYVTGLARWTAERLTGCRTFLELDSADMEIYGRQPDELLDAIDDFVRGLGGHRVEDVGQRVFSVLLFTDLVGSTEQAAVLGDRRWTELLELHDEVTARQVTRAGGRLVDRAGDGLLASFDAPARAVRCAQAISAEVRQLGLEVRAGVHAGEVELRGDQVAGIAVHIAARVQATAGPGEVLVSRTVKDLVAGSGLVLEDRGDHVLKGVPEPWQLYAVVDAVQV